MVRRVLTTIVTVTMLVSSLGCSITKPRTIEKSEYAPVRNEKVLEVYLLTGDTIKFDSRGGVYSSDRRVIRGTSTDGTDVEVNMADVQSVRVERRSDGLSFTATVLGLAVLGVGTMYLLLMHAQWFSD
jgi:hypothetical protein